MFDLELGIPYLWDLALDGHTEFPLVSWSKRLGDTERYGEGILANGDLISINDDSVPNDSLLGDTYIADDYIADGYYQEYTDSGTSIVMTSRLGMFDGGTNQYKFLSSVRPVCNKTPNTQTLTVKWADENNESFSAGRTIDTSLNGKLTRLGRFQRRNHQIEYSGDEQIRIEAIEID